MDDFEPDEDMELPGDPSDDPAACPFSPAAEPPIKPVFTSPQRPGDAVEEELSKLMRAAEPGSTIHVSAHSFTSEALAAELVEAADRGVAVYVVVDGQNRVESDAGGWVPNPAVGALRDGLGADRVVMCSEDEEPEFLRGGCIGGGANFNSFALFSELCDGSQSVVYQLSANLRPAQDALYHNGLVVRDDDALYSGYRSYWDDEAAGVSSADYYRRIEGDGARAFFYPRASEGQTNTDPGSDTVSNVLSGVECAGGTRIRAAMANWTSGRDYLIGQLYDLAQSGCDIGLIVDRRTPIADTLQDHFTGEQLLITDGIRHKYFSIDGIFNGQPEQLVWTGSHHWVYSALRTSEDVLIRIDDPAVFEAYVEDWTALWIREAAVE